MRVKRHPFLASILILALLPAVLSACAARQSPAAPVIPDSSEPNLQATAAAEATMIVQRAEATAMVLQAQAQAAARIAQANEPLGSHTAKEASPPAAKPAQASAQNTSSSPPNKDEPATPEATAEQTVEVIGVGFAGEGGLIIIQFKAPPKVADRWWQGSVTLTDEATGTVFEEIPVMPKIGPLISRPQVYGQVGYVMLVNGPEPLLPGSLVTVMLGNYTFEHMKVE